MQEASSSLGCWPVLWVVPVCPDSLPGRDLLLAKEFRSRGSGNFKEPVGRILGSFSMRNLQIPKPVEEVLELSLTPGQVGLTGRAPPGNRIVKQTDLLWDQAVSS